MNKIDPSILKKYKKEARKWMANEEDKDLDTIEVPLPEAPEWETIEGYGLPAEDQFFERDKLPHKIVELQNEQDKDGNYLTQDEIWDRMNSDFAYYEEEFKWIKKQWGRILYGYWFFCNGQPTYITGWNYFYLTFWQLLFKPKPIPHLPYLLIGTSLFLCLASFGIFPNRIYIILV